MTDAATEIMRTVQLSRVVYGPEAVADDDPAETYHEASKLHPSFLGRQTRGHLLETNAALRVSTGRAVKRHRHVPHTVLPEPALPECAFGDVVEQRSSVRGFADEPIGLGELATLLHAGYGATRKLLEDARPGATPLLRTVPSAGALYPLELYVLPWRVDGLAPGLHHFDPLRHVLERLDAADHTAGVERAAVYPDVATGCAALIVVSAVFWRSRFKYGLRAYRFTLLEAGHVAQNILLAATALRLASIPLGGFYDALFDELLGLDGVNESVLYLVAVGRAEGRV